MEKDRDSGMDQIKIEPFTIVYDILKNWWVVLLGAVAAALMSYVVVSETYVPQYATSATFVVASKGDSNALNNLYSANEMAKMFEKILQSNTMKKVICEKMGTKELDAEITAGAIEGTNLLSLKIVGKSPKQVIDLMRVIMENYSSVSYYSVGNAVLDVLEEPKIPFSPINGLDAKGAAKKGFLLGGMFLAALFGFVSYMNDTIKREEDIERKLDARNLGVIEHTRKYKTWKDAVKHEKNALLISNPLAEFGFVEGYRKLATKIDYQMMKDDRKVLVVTSVSENEGKSTVAANIAIALADQSKKVLLIEGDLRRPSQFLLFGQEPKEESEIGEYLKGNAKLRDILVESEYPRLYLMVGRNCYSSSTEMLHSEKMHEILNFGKKLMDYIIIDSPPAGLMGDAEALAEYADAVMVVAKQNCIKAEDINDVLDSFRAHHSKVLGVVLNDVRTLSSVTVNHGKYGKYGKYGAYGDYNGSKGN